MGGATPDDPEPNRGLIAVSSRLDPARQKIAEAMIGAIRLVAAERDRDEVIRWFLNAREILARDASRAETAKALYGSVNTVRVAQLVGSTVKTGLGSYNGANLPLALKVALPVTAIGTGFLGLKGAGIVALGNAIGLPVVVLLFLGTAGVTTIVETFVRNREVRDPLTQLLLMCVTYEKNRRAKRELLDALRADAMVPKRAELSEHESDVLGELLALDPIAFERHVMSYFADEGHPTGLTARSNDFGVDGFVFHPDGVVVVQCKRYALDNPVGRPLIQQFKGVIEEQRAFRGYVVTTSRFTADAIESAGQSDRLRLIDGTVLVDWVLNGRATDGFS